ncbi:hypothetical protein F4859DRAFT_326097 [Xylaria cf. heliscus]|nr:hypothetical protein F4859DRAFT_326097 [Xylaria cf. heliscus]
MDGSGIWVLFWSIYLTFDAGDQCRYTGTSDLIRRLRLQQLLQQLGTLDPWVLGTFTARIRSVDHLIIRPSVLIAGLQNNTKRLDEWGGGNKGRASQPPASSQQPIVMDPMIEIGRHGCQ